MSAGGEQMAEREGQVHNNKKRVVVTGLGALTPI